MLGANYQDIGAGVAEVDGFVYYTIDVGYVAGGGNYSPPGVNTPIVGTPGGPTPLPVYMVQTATRNPDDSIVHVVRSGQTLIGIAIAYGVTVNEIKELNYLTGDEIYEGDTLTIRPAGTPDPTATVTATQTPTRAASPTRKPTRTPAGFQSQPSGHTGRACAKGSRAGSISSGPLVIAIIVLAPGDNSDGREQFYQTELRR
jgi:hypothetical protein